VATYTQSVVSGAFVGDGSVSDATISPTGAEITTVETTTAGVEYVPTATPSGAELGTYYGTEGVIIPTGEFRPVVVEIEDDRGEPIPEAEWVRSAGLFPTSGRVQTVDDGRTYARLWLLPEKYDQLALTARSGRVVYVWDEIPGPDGEKGVRKNERYTTATFEKKFKRGLDASNGVNMGGNLSL